MDEQGPAAQQLVSCPHCGIPTRLIECTTVVRFPDDVGDLDRIVTAEFNSFRHFCGRRISVLSPVLVCRPEERIAVVVAARAADMGLPDHDWQIVEVEDYQGLQAHVIEWLAAEGRALWEMVEDESLFELDRAGRIAAVTPARLLAWALEARGRRASARSDVEHEQAAQADELLVAILSDHLRLLALEAAFASAVHDVIDLVRRAVPARCLTPVLFDALAEACDDDVLTTSPDRDRVAAAFRAELICAVTHVIAGRENPRQDRWALLVATLWAWSQRDDAEIDDRFFLDAPALQATLPFDVLVGAAARVGLPGGFDDLRAVRRFSATFEGLMDRAGYGPLFREQISGVVTQALARSRPTAGPAELFAIVGEAMAAHPVEGLTIGDVASGFADRWTQAVPDRTVEMVTGLLAHLAEHATLEDRCRYVAGATEWLNARHEWGLAGRIVDDLLVELEHREPDLPGAERVHLWNEIGNTFRYLGDHPRALAAYGVAERGCDGLPDADDRLAVLARNRAIVLRDSGRLREAEAALLALAAENPDDPGLLHSLSVLYDRSGEPEKAAGPLARALASPTVRPADAALFLLSRAELHRRAQRDDTALGDLRRAWRLQPASSLDARLRIAAVAAASRPSEAANVAFRDELVAFALDRAPGVAHVDNGAGAAALVAVAESALQRGDTAAARAALEIVLPAPRDPAQYRAGQVAVDWAWLLVLEGSRPEALPWLKSGLRSIEADVPSGADAGFALTWLGRVTEVVDRVLELAPQVTSEPSELIAVYEMANGRELTAGQDPDDLSDWAERIGGAARDAGCDVVVVLDGADRLTVIVLSASGAAPVVRQIELTATELDLAVGRLEAFDRANPVAPHRIDARLGEWWRVAGMLADTVRPHLGTGTEVVFLPGRRLASTPLHLAGWPEAPLIAERPVGVCPNARVLLTPQAPGDGSVGVVVVPKSSDSARFRDGLRAAADEIAEGARRVRVLPELRADERAVLDLAAETDEIVFLCHGVTSSGTGRGPGICVSAGGHLPPSPLPVESDPDLGSFALSWTDLVELPRGPRTVVSMACSTGRSLVGAGGTRIGLEQGFLTRGGDAIISPLWNIDQEPSLAWLRAFYARHVPGTTADIGVAHRLACLDTRASHPHPFAWGPFLLTRRLTKDRP